jgi:hypothetical protein
MDLWGPEVPRRVQIGPTSYRIQVETEVRRDDNDQRLWGQHRAGDSVIRIDAGQSRQHARTTILHEVLHAVDYTVAGSSDCQMSEEMIDRLSFALLAMMRQNPSLIAFLLGDDDGETETAVPSGAGGGTGGAGGGSIDIGSGVVSFRGDHGRG